MPRWLSETAQADRDRKKRQPRGERSGGAKITEKDVLTIRSSGDSVCTIARRLGISHSLVSLIISRRRWRHI